MTLMDILAGLPIQIDSAADPPITSVVTDSRHVRAGSLFVALRGEKTDGYLFAAQAADAGAAAILSDRPRPEGITIPWVTGRDPRHLVALLACRFWADPSARLRMAGVTGTNGKTTVATLLAGILSRACGSCGFLGTVGYRWKSTVRDAPRTTPEATELTSMLAEMVDEGVCACSMEVSSHALSLDRVAGISFDVAVFTNLTRDHFDFHGDFEGYYSAKKRLFDRRKPGAAAVINHDDPFGGRLLDEVSGRKYSFSFSGNPAADFRASEIGCDLAGTALTISDADGSHRVKSPLLGRFNAENLLAAWAGARALEIPAATIVAELAENRGAPGRMESVAAGQSFVILVDYAHTEDALRRLLQAVREITDKSIIVVFGCGGDRDPGKREPMGRAAAELSDIPIVTSDNPRGENPEEILRQVEAGLVAGGASKFLKFVDRAEAIQAAIDMANSRSVVVIAGKGHETTQIVGGRSIPFDDRLAAADAVRRARRFPAS